MNGTNELATEQPDFETLTRNMKWSQITSRDYRRTNECDWLRSIIVGGGTWLWETATNGYGY